MVPPHHIMRDAILNSKQSLRRNFRTARREYVSGLPETIRALLFKRPPAPLMDLVPADAVIGLYHTAESEAPASNYARFFFEAGHRIALPRITGAEGMMEFHSHSDPFGESDLEAGPHGLMQPGNDADVVTPDVVFVPLLAFTEDGGRLGQGGGFYDRWLAAHPGVQAIGLAWDMQLAEYLPVQPHDVSLNAVVTPTRIYGPFNAR